jgi:hypothetical protein
LCIPSRACATNPLHHSSRSGRISWTNDFPAGISSKAWSFVPRFAPTNRLSMLCPKDDHPYGLLPLLCCLGDSPDSPMLERGITDDRTFSLPPEAICLCHVPPLRYYLQTCLNLLMPDPVASNSLALPCFKCTCTLLLLIPDSVISNSIAPRYPGFTCALSPLTYRLMI